jgi:hypothetical protein
MARFEMACSVRSENSGTLGKLGSIMPLLEECFGVVLASCYEYSGRIVKCTKVLGCSAVKIVRLH